MLITSIFNQISSCSKFFWSSHLAKNHLAKNNLAKIHLANVQLIESCLGRVFNSKLDSFVVLQFCGQYYKPFTAVITPLAVYFSMILAELRR